jgi:hypothetical protein
MIAAVGLIRIIQDLLVNQVALFVIIRDSNIPYKLERSNSLLLCVILPYLKSVMTCNIFYPFSKRIRYLILATFIDWSE